MPDPVRGRKTKVQCKRDFFSRSLPF